MRAGVQPIPFTPNSRRNMNFWVRNESGAIKMPKSAKLGMVCMVFTTTKMGFSKNCRLKAVIPRAMPMKAATVVDDISSKIMIGGTEVGVMQHIDQWESVQKDMGFI